MIDYRGLNGLTRSLLLRNPPGRSLVVLSGRVVENKGYRELTPCFDTVSFDDELFAALMTITTWQQLSQLGWKPHG